MNLVRIANFIARRTPWKQLHGVPASDLDEFVACINRGVAAWYREAPSSQTQGKLTEILKAPVDVDITIVDGAKGFAVSGVTPAWLVSDFTQAVGCNVMVGDDPKWNYLTTESTLALPYSGAGGTQSMRVSFNAIHLGEDEPRVTGSVFARGVAQNMPYQLHSITTDALNILYNGSEVGAPRHYIVTPLETWQSADPRFVLRVFPTPSSDTIIDTMVERRTAMYTLADLMPPGVAIPIPEHELQSIVLPICYGAVLEAGMLDRTRFDASMVRDAALAAMGTIGRVVNRQDPEPLMMGTPWNY